MPRVCLTREQRREARLQAGNEAMRVGLDTSLSKSRTTQRAVAERVNVTEARLSRLKSDPGMMRLDLFRDIVHESGMTDDMILAVVRGRRL